MRSRITPNHVWIVSSIHKSYESYFWAGFFSVTWFFWFWFLENFGNQRNPVPGFSQTLKEYAVFMK
jgi:hypothetical protein